MPVKPSPPTPSAAASLVLLRDGDAGLEILLLQRHRASRFAAGDHVFAGGRLEDDDNPAGAAAWCAGLDAATAGRVLGLEDAPGAAIGYWVGAIREAFEEVGVLLARGPDGAPVCLDEATAASYRRACQADNRAFRDMVRAERLTLATDGLVYFAHWITPEGRPLRFDTRFFAAPMPPGQTAVADEREIVGVRWLTVRDALAARSRGEISLRLPTIKNLERFAGARSVVEALDRLRGQPVPTIRPRIVMDGDVPRSLLPGDPGY